MKKSATVLSESKFTLKTEDMVIMERKSKDPNRNPKASRYRTCIAVAVVSMLLLAGMPVTQAQEAPFITVWKTDNHGASADNQISIRGEGEGYTIEWEEVDHPENHGSETASDDHTITFPHPGMYRVKISGNFTRFYFPFIDIPPADRNDSRKLLKVEQWGDIAWRSMELAFYRTTNLEVTATDIPDLSNVTSMKEMFFSSAFNGDVSSWDVSNVTNLEGVFHGAVSFNGDVSNWNVSKVTNLARAFYVASSFNVDVSNWDVGNVTDMYLTFALASSFNVDVSNWDVGNVTNMNSTFWAASSFDRDLSGWDMSRALTTSGMLSGSGLSVENYDKTLIGWAEQELTPGLTLGADSLRYCHSAEQRQYIIDNFEWRINDAGIDDDCKVTSTEDQAGPFEFQLKQNYPNPFNPSTRIRYTLAEPSHVRLEIFDVTGRRVAFPVDGFQTAGRYDIMFDASELAGGAYLYRLSAGTTSASKIMMLIK